MNAQARWHDIAVDGVFEKAGEGVRFHEAPAPKKTDVEDVSRRVHDRRLAARVARRDPGPAPLLVSFAASLRRSKLVALQVPDVTTCREGLAVRFGWSKTDQDGAGEVIDAPFGASPTTCPLRAWQAWLDASGITRGRSSAGSPGCPLANAKSLAVFPVVADPPCVR